jgi:hypothetical protein
MTRDFDHRVVFVTAAGDAPRVTPDGTLGVTV